MITSINDYEQEIINLGGKIYYVPEFTGSNIVFYILAWEKLFQENPEYKIIHSQIWSTAGIFLSLAKRYGLYTIAHSHSVSARSGISAIGRLILRRLFPIKADHYMACSYVAAKWLFGDTIIKGENFNILPNAINLDLFRFQKETRIRIREKYGVEGDIVVGHVGMFDANKNQEFIVDLFHIFHSLKPTSILWLVGSGPSIARVMQKANKYGDPVVFWGVREDIPELLQGMDIFLFPSNFESFGNAALEAQAAGLKVICSDTISDEVAVTNQITFLPLTKPEKWIAEMIKSINTKRQDTYYQLSDTKYDIKSSAAWLQNFYLKCLNDQQQYRHL